LLQEGFIQPLRVTKDATGWSIGFRALLVRAKDANIALVTLAEFAPCSTEKVSVLSAPHPAQGFHSLFRVQTRKPFLQSHSVCLLQKGFIQPLRVTKNAAGWSIGFRALLLRAKDANVSLVTLAKADVRRCCWHRCLREALARTTGIVAVAQKGATKEQPACLCKTPKKHYTEQSSSQAKTQRVLHCTWLHDSHLFFCFCADLGFCLRGVSTSAAHRASHCSDPPPFELSL
jgi:hypothetical protein